VAAGGPESRGIAPIYYNSAGAVAIFINTVYTQTLISPVQYANNRFGVTVQMSGNILLVGESGGNYMHLFTLTMPNGSLPTYVFNATLTNFTSFPIGAAISYYNGQALLGEGNYITAGIVQSVPLYNVISPTATCQYQFKGSITGPNDNFGSSVGLLSPDGGNTTLAIIGSMSAISDNTTSTRGGAVFIFCANQNGSSCSNCSGVINRCGVCDGPLNCTAPFITTGERCYLLLY